MKVLFVSWLIFANYQPTIISLSSPSTLAVKVGLNLYYYDLFEFFPLLQQKEYCFFKLNMQITYFFREILEKQWNFFLNST